MEEIKEIFKILFDKKWPGDMISRTKSTENAELAENNNDD